MPTHFCTGNPCKICSSYGFEFKQSHELTFAPNPPECHCKSTLHGGDGQYHTIPGRSRDGWRYDSNCSTPHDYGCGFAVAMYRPQESVADIERRLEELLPVARAVVSSRRGETLSVAAHPEEGYTFDEVSRAIWYTSGATAWPIVDVAVTRRPPKSLKTSPRELCCTCDEAHRATMSGSKQWRGVTINYANALSGMDPEWHENTCPVSPVSGVHGGMRLHPVGGWETRGNTFWNLHGVSVDFDDLRWQDAMRQCCPAQGDIMLMAFFHPPETEDERPCDTRPSVHHPDDPDDVCHRDVASWELR